MLVLINESNGAKMLIVPAATYSVENGAVVADSMRFAPYFSYPKT